MKSIATFLFILSLALGHFAFIQAPEKEPQLSPQDVMKSVEQVDEINKNSFKTWIRPTN